MKGRYIAGKLSWSNALYWPLQTAPLVFDTLCESGARIGSPCILLSEWYGPRKDLGSSFMQVCSIGVEILELQWSKNNDWFLLDIANLGRSTVNLQNGT